MEVSQNGGPPKWMLHIIKKHQKIPEPKPGSKSAAKLAPPNPAVFFGEGWPDPCREPLCLALENMGILWENDENMIEMMGKFYGF